MKMSSLFEMLTLIGMHMGMNYVEVVYHDAHKRYFYVYMIYEEELLYEKTQLPEVYPGSLESLVKQTYEQLATLRSISSTA